MPAKYESKVVRTLTNPNNEPRTSNGRTPHHLLDGTITPNGLHFVVARAGFPDIRALTRFRMPWRWDGQPVVLQSRAWDEASNVQPTRSEMFAECGEPRVNTPVTALPTGHMNVITSWAADNKGEIKHVYG